MNVFVPSLSVSEDLYYFTGLLNSKLLWKWFTHHAKRRGVGLEINGNVLSRAPMRMIDFANAADRTRHDRMVQLVTQILEAKEQLAAAQTERDKSFYESKCAALDRQIDYFVYELYGLNSDEIKLVEEGAR